MTNSGKRKLAVVAVGGNALVREKGKETLPEQYAAACLTMPHVVAMIESGWNVIVTHGNGPQVGFILRRSELSAHELHTIPLDYCGSNTQGSIGYMFQTALNNEFARHAMPNQAVTVVTQTLVDPNDPAFTNPTKPIGSFMSEAVAKKHCEEDGWVVVEDAGRGWRRVVPSPIPQRIVEAAAIRNLIDAGFTVVGVGGGGIPVLEDPDGALHGVEAVIDKDFGSALLATMINADLFIISTAVAQVAINFNKPNQQWLSRMTIAEAEAYIAQGHFAKGSMLPKIQASLQYLRNGGKQALITDPANIGRALNGETGTWIVP